MQAKHQRLLLIITGLSISAIALSLILYALEDTVTFFYSPTDIQTASIADGKTIRVGGLVEIGSVKTSTDGLTTRFILTDHQHHITIHYTGLLPTLFREGQGMIAQGTLQPNGDFHANELLAKHDENYMPPEVKDALEH